MKRFVHRIAAPLLACVLLWGCAAQTAFREGQARVAQDELPQALDKFSEAVRLEPGSAEYRAAYLRTLERLIGRTLARADSAFTGNDLTTAEAGYRQVLALAAGNERAQAGLRQVDLQRRAVRVIRDAEAAAARSDWEGVRTQLRPLLLEAPAHRRGRELLQQAEEALAKAAETAPTAEKALAAAYRKPISIEFRDTPLKTIFEVIARSSGLNFVIDKDVRTDQRASIFLKNSTVEAAVGMLLTSNQLDQRVLDGNSVLIYPNTPAKQKDYQPLTVRSFYLANAEAKAVAATLKSLLKVREVAIDEKLNLVILRDTPEAIRVAEKVVALHDVPEPEVMLEVEILEVKRTRLLDLGVRWPEQLSLAPLPSTTGGALTLSDLRNLDSSTVGATLGSLSINARKTDTDANILANPRIRARNREKAKIHIGERVPNISITSTPTTGFVSESVTYVDVGLKLDVEPTIYLDNEVAIKIGLEVSNIISQVQTKSGTLAYQIGTRTASTVLRLKDGENQVLAGLINDEDRRSANKVPGLGEVPVVGRLFGSQADDSAKTEIVLSITPRVVRNVQRPSAAAQEFDSGTESSIGGGGAAGTAPARPPAGAAPARPAGLTGAPATTPSSPAPASGLSTPSPVVDTASVAGGVAVGGGVATAAGNSVSLRWDAPAAVRAGDTFVVSVLARGDLPVTALPVVLSFDPQVLQVVAVTEGGFLRQGGATTSFTSQIDPAGRISVTASRGGGTGAVNEAPAFTLSLKVLGRPASGQTTLQLVSAAPTGLQGRALAVQAPTALAVTVQP